ncbi:divergent protein kinase domain 2A-like [Penaeus japonicus]|uniref:divergent protein kinase domain 2A-like n=1 Tax=Penaeus japonicus TaxID=27405 RepID=UPI001C7176B6|nr:divergent protein kinase domain 2A-like [Penaeus japonicus]XP_042864551.1 divergent protein kinase domain 2A-like [Penaeus japonicus]XP_042864552.1 divergent protein kinase domain 2A-like [Penaeus japonicus]XP_042864553.1 divergent protein kinase domain 2A-like [Penaeus japonicus]XP_042864554.1 divergent protein kinase domain 2A-like [Penaeus japonicus]XP_042864555.1 divergent protein kinase domain 2A-like [Penaeus japonicus]XP_042864556.1 divergent protein kinase domain 2A-like [Penaeus j
MIKRRWQPCKLFLGIVITLIFFYGWYQKVDDIVDLETCPACYGQTLCSTLVGHQEPLSERLQLTSFSKWKILNLVNVKNVYYGEMRDMPVVLKKLAHSSELREFDERVCKVAEQTENCSISQALKLLLAREGQDVLQVVNKYPDLFESSDAVKCNHSRTVEVLYENFMKTDRGPYHQHHFLTMLAVNIEPLVISTYHSSFFPRLIGTCGRVIVEDYVGPTLTQQADEPWIVRADYSRQLLEMAQQFSSGTFVLYLTDVSLDNFAVSDDGSVKVIDAENIVIVDTSLKGLDVTEHVNDGFGCADCLSFSYDDLCGHASSDHNFYAVCKGMLSSSAFSEDLPQGLLHSAPDWVLRKYPKLFPLIEECGYHPLIKPNKPSANRKGAAKDLHTLLVTVLEQYNT